MSNWIVALFVLIILLVFANIAVRISINNFRKYLQDRIKSLQEEIDRDFGGSQVDLTAFATDRSPSFGDASSDPGLDGARSRGLAANSEGRWAEAYRLLLPFAEAGDVEIQGILGSIMQFSLHRFDGTNPFNEGEGPEIDEASALEDQDQAARFLEAASRAGSGPATFNLAGLIVGGHGGGSWDERKARAAELYALAHDQGFTAFGWLTRGEAPGQPYLDLLERHAAGSSPDGVKPE